MFFLRLMIMAAALAGLSFATPINAAATANGGTATQSTTFVYNNVEYPAILANNGINDAGSITTAELSPWWEVKFASSYLISSVNVYLGPETATDQFNPVSVTLFGSDEEIVWTDSVVLTRGITSLNFLELSFEASRLRVQWYPSQFAASGYLRLADVVAMGELGDAEVAPTPDGATPEPATYALMAGGLAFIVIIHRRRR